MVRCQSMSAWRRGRLTLAARFSAPVSAVRVRWASLRSSSSTTLRTTERADSLALAGITRLSESSVPTRCTSGSTASSISGSSSNRVRSSRSIASFCITWTTVEGKNLRMSPSQRATRGAEAPRPAPRRASPPSSLSYSAASAASTRASSPASPTPVPSSPPSPPPSASRQRRSRSSLTTGHLQAEDPRHRVDGRRGTGLVDLVGVGLGLGTPARAEVADLLADGAALRGGEGGGEPAGVEQQPGQPAVDQAVQVLAVADGGERRLPAAAQLGVGQQADGGVERLDVAEQLARRVVVQPGDRRR